MAGEKAVLPTYDDLAELARICARYARKATGSKVVAAELWRMATEYQARAAQVDSGKMLDIGSSPEL
jgi:hypothetical protein